LCKDILSRRIRKLDRTFRRNAFALWCKLSSTSMSFCFFLFFNFQDLWHFPSNTKIEVLRLVVIFLDIQNSKFIWIGEHNVQGIDTKSFYKRTFSLLWQRTIMICDSMILNIELASFQYSVALFLEFNYIVMKKKILGIKNKERFKATLVGRPSALSWLVCIKLMCIWLAGKSARNFAPSAFFPTYVYILYSDLIIPSESPLKSGWYKNIIPFFTRIGATCSFAIT